MSDQRRIQSSRELVIEALHRRQQLAAQQDQTLTAQSVETLRKTIEALSDEEYEAEAMFA